MASPIPATGGGKCRSLIWVARVACSLRAVNSVRESTEFTALKEQATLATQINDLHFPPPVAGIGDAMPEFEKALNAAVLGGQDPKTVLSDAAGRATKILEANAKKYGA